MLSRKLKTNCSFLASKKEFLRVAVCYVVNGNPQNQWHKYHRKHVVLQTFEDVQQNNKKRHQQETQFVNSTSSATDQIDNIQTEWMVNKTNYLEELERLENENKELHKQILYLRQGRKFLPKKVNEDIYSEVLDELADFDNGYNIADQLPRVVVVGDQSNGKTSVLEMIAQARIFPRGAGEMMTRAPVKVTLSEGPYHVAQFRDSSREFDLTNESDLARVRQEVEHRMIKSVQKGKTISSEVISMTVKGPGIRRIVLVDLPGIISTQTVGMAADTRETIKTMTKSYMNNPNAIILCIQDGSVDAERSNVTDLVAQCDPSGKRTIFVLTKADLAESNLASPNKIEKILDGKLFPMKALGYFAVITGRGRRDDSIQTIQEYEEHFFGNTNLFKNNVKSSQLSTRNLSLAISDCFWEMVKNTVRSQTDAFRTRRYNLEAEWKNNFQKYRQLDREELFERARVEILDEIVHLTEVKARQWEENLQNKLWSKVSDYVFENIYLPAIESDNREIFKTFVDIRLRSWADSELPLKSLEAGWETLTEEFVKLIEKAKQRDNHDEIHDGLKEAVIKEAMARHSMQKKVSEVLKVIQLNTLEDCAVCDKNDWLNALKFFESTINKKLRETEKVLKNFLGSPEKGRKSWFNWSSPSLDEKLRRAVKLELEKVIKANKMQSAQLSSENLTTVKNNLLRSKMEVVDEYITEMWKPMYWKHALEQSLSKGFKSKIVFYMKQDVDPDCEEVILFYRIHQMLKVTTNALRQQIMNREAKSFEKEIKEVLNNYSEDSSIKEAFLGGRRVTLAIELERVKQIIDHLEEFIQVLNKEK